MSKTLIATGGSSGLGFEAIRQLLVESEDETAYTVIVGCRDISATKAAYQSVKIPACHELRYLPLELSSLASTKCFAEAVIDQLGETRLDILLLCAGISKAASPEEQKGSQWSQAYMVNYAAQQKLLHLLENKVRESHARIVVVTSMLYKKISDPDLLEGTVSSSSTASALEIYRSTKFIQLTSVLRWQERLAGDCTVIAVSPGFVPVTGLSRETGFIAGLFMQYILPWAPFATSLREGGEAILRAILLEDTQQQGEQRNSVLMKNGEWEPVNEIVSDKSVIDRWWLSRKTRKPYREVTLNPNSM